tara:strand:+ start:861 stop:1094 length:234 start_codon:yes stop_codon:yes gene_type:complete
MEELKYYPDIMNYIIDEFHTPTPTALTKLNRYKLIKELDTIIQMWKEQLEDMPHIQLTFYEYFICYIDFFKPYFISQ